MLILFAGPATNEPELREEVASIGKDAAEEDARIAAAEGHEHSARNIHEFSKETEKTPGSISGLEIVIEKTPLQTMGPLSVFLPSLDTEHRLIRCSKCRL